MGRHSADPLQPGLREEAASFQARGWAGYKLHPPQQPKLDVRCCEAARRAVGDDYTLMLDATWAYDYPTALRVGRAIEDLGYHWYEDPMGEWDITNYVKLRQKLDIPIMATEFPAISLEMTTRPSTANTIATLGG